MLNKILNIALILALVLPGFFVPSNVLAADNRTIKSIRAELEKQRQDLENNRNQQTLTEEEIAATRAKVESIAKSIKEGQEQVYKLNDEIAELEVDIADKQEEIKRIVNFLQISSGESEYMEYIFGAKTFTDFIYRMSISEQLANYNDQLIDEYNSMIESNKQKQEEIKAKEVELGEQQVQMQEQIARLQTQKINLSSEEGDIETGINEAERQLNDLIAQGCYEDETVDACYSRTNSLPSDTSFWRPLVSARVTSEYGWRTYWGNGQYITDFHYGLDMGASIGTPVYSVASGKVILTTDRWYSGIGHAIYIHHLINGQRYTSVYEHLNSYNVSEGQTVTKDTVIAYSGNTGASYGAHLHISIIKGWSGIDFSYWSNDYYNRNVDPASVINFPREGYSFTTRTRYCTAFGNC